MLIFRDILSGDEIASDAYDVIVPTDAGGCLYEINGKMIKPGQESFVLEGANASAEGEDADDGDAEGDNTPKLDLAVSFRYQKLDSPPTAKQFSSEAKKYLKNVMKKMQEVGRPAEEIDEFKKGAPVALKKITANWSNYDVYLGESAEPDGEGNSMYILVDFRDDGLTPYISIWKHAVEEYKV